MSVVWQILALLTGTATAYLYYRALQLQRVALEWQRQFNQVTVLMTCNQRYLEVRNRELALKNNIRELARKLASSEVTEKHFREVVEEWLRDFHARFWEFQAEQFYFYVRGLLPEVSYENWMHRLKNDFRNNDMVWDSNGPVKVSKLKYNTIREGFDLASQELLKHEGSLGFFLLFLVEDTPFKDALAQVGDVPEPLPKRKAR